MYILDKLAFKFKAGDNIVITVVNQGVISDAWYYSYITNIDGNGQMYESIDDFVCCAYGDFNADIKLAIKNNTLTIEQAIILCTQDNNLIEFTNTIIPDIKWTHVQANTLNFILIPAISQSIVIPDGITSIANKFMFGFVVNNIVLGKDVQSIGEYAFCSTGLTDVTWNDGYGNFFEKLVFPRSLEYIGKKAFCNSIKLKEIYFKNKNYSLDKYDYLQGIFYIELDKGDDLDEDGNQRTYVYSPNPLVKAYDWIYNYHRTIYSREIGRYHCWDEANGDQSFRIYEQPETTYSRGYYIDSLGVSGYVSMTDMNDVMGGNRVQYVNNQSMRFKY